MSQMATAATRRGVRWMSRLETTRQAPRTLGATARFYRRMLGATWVAGVAALVYAVDDARGATVGFIANRNVLVAAAFGVPALIAHDRARRDGSRPAAWLAPLLLAGALFSKEEG